MGAYAELCADLDRLHAQDAARDERLAKAHAADWAGVAEMADWMSGHKARMAKCGKQAGKMTDLVAKALGFDPAIDPSRLLEDTGGHNADGNDAAQQIGRARAMLRDAIAKGSMSAVEVARAESIINAFERETADEMRSAETMGKSMFGPELRSLKLEVDIEHANNVLRGAVRAGLDAVTAARWESRLHNLATTGRFN